jgi:hypothetical protein
VSPNYLLLSLLTIIFLEIFFILMQTVKKITFSHHASSKDAILIAPNFISHCGVRRAEGLGNDNRKTMIKIKTVGQKLPFKKWHGFAQSLSSDLLCQFFDISTHQYFLIILSSSAQGMPTVSLIC